MTVEGHKRAILRDLAVILEKDDDLAPEPMPDEEYAQWAQARDELVREFEARSKLR